MSFSDSATESKIRFGGLLNWGMFWLIVATLAALVFFDDGIKALLEAWQRPEYSHGPLIPLLSALLFLRQLKTVPENHGAADRRWNGVVVIVG